MSARPRATMSSATSGVLIRLVPISGTLTSPISRAVAQIQPPRGTAWVMVGTGASCQPTPELMMSAPAASAALARATTSSNGLPPSTTSSAEIRYMTMKSGAVAARTASMTAIGKRLRFSNGPPHQSSRLLVRGAGELVDQIAFRAHDLDTVIAGVAGDDGGTGIVRDGALDVRIGHFARRVLVDRRLDRRRRNDVGGDIRSARHGAAAKGCARPRGEPLASPAGDGPRRPRPDSRRPHPSGPPRWARSRRSPSAHSRRGHARRRTPRDGQVPPPPVPPDLYASIPSAPCSAGCAGRSQSARRGAERGRKLLSLCRPVVAPGLNRGPPETRQSRGRRNALTGMASAAVRKILTNCTV